MPDDRPTTSSEAPGRRRTRRLTFAVGIACAALAIAACSDDDDAATPSGADATESTAARDESTTVAIVDFAFDPAEVTVAPGAEIVFENGDDAAHTATAEDVFDTESVGGGESATITAPEEPDSYPYICKLHPFMKGTIVVS